MSHPPGARGAGGMDVAVTALGPMSWGTAYVVISELLPPDHPLFTAVVRALPVGLLMLLFARTLPRGSWWWRSAVVGMANIGVFFPAVYLAADRLEAGLAATLSATVPLAVIGTGRIVLRTRPRAVEVVAAVIGLCGVALLVLRQSAPVDVVGVAGAAAAVVSAAWGIVLIKRWGQPVGSVAFTAWQLVWGGLVLLPLTLAFEGAPSELDAGAVVGFAYLAVVVTGLGYVVWFRGIGLLQPVAVSTLVLLTPLVGTASGVVVNGEAFGPFHASGTALILVGVVLGQPVLRRQLRGLVSARRLGDRAA